MLSISVLVSQLVFAQITYETVYPDFDSARTFKNLRVIPIRWLGQRAELAKAESVLSLSEGVKQGLVTVTERGTASTENVHWLRINNKSDRPLYVSSGELVAGGRQDRMIAEDTVLIPNGGDQYVRAMCVEEDRWSEKERKFNYVGYANPRLRKAMDIDKNQLVIWREIYAQLDSTKMVNPTLSYVAKKTDKKYIPRQNEYLEFFREQFERNDTTVLGIVCISGNKILGADIFSSHLLFKEEALPLLEGYIDEAILFGKTPTVKDEKVKEYLDQFLTDEETQAEYCKKYGKLYRYKGKVFHLTAY
jgi:hypothetical protein